MRHDDVMIGMNHFGASAPYQRGLPFNTSPHDVTTIAGATIVLITAAVAASVWPALRAGRVDPMRALKTD